MRKLPIICAAGIALASVAPALAEGPSTQPSRKITDVDAVRAEKASEAQVPGDLSLRSLPAVLDAINRHQDWHEAAQQAQDKINSPELRSKVAQELSAVVPHVAKDLLAQPTRVGLVMVSVYQQQGAQNKPQMVGVTYLGTEQQVPPLFYSDLLADFPEAPSGKGVPEKLALDRQASSYLVFSVYKGDLKASDIPHDQMKQSLGVAMNKAAAKNEPGTRTEVARNDTASRAAARQEAPPEAQQASAGQTTIINQVYPDVNDWSNDYYGVGVPVYIVPSGPIVWSRDDVRRWRDRARERHERFHLGPNTAQQPNMVANQPNMVANQPRATARQPDAVAHQPSNVAHQPNNVAHQPNETARQPNSTARQSGETSRQSSQSSNQNTRQEAPAGNRAPAQSGNSGGQSGSASGGQASGTKK